MAARVSTACDACRLRKVKCLQAPQEPRCSQCTHLDLQCNFSTIKQARRPPQRGRIIQQYRDSTGSRSRASPSPLLAAPRPTLMHAASSTVSHSEGSPGSPESLNLRSEYSQEFFLEMLPTFRQSVFPFHPILSEFELRSAITNMYNSRDDFSLVHAFGGVVLNTERDIEYMRIVDNLCQRSLESRRAFGPDAASFSVYNIIACTWVENCMAALQKYDLAFFYLRESISMMQILKIDDPATLARLPLAERARRQRLYWEIYIHERYMGIMDYRPVVMRPLYTLPERDDSIPLSCHLGFIAITTLFLLIDQEFAENWHNYRRGGTITADWIEKKQIELDEELKEGSNIDMAMLTDMQQADLTVTRQWLRTLVWQMAMSKYLLSSRADTKECMSLMFPVKLSRQLRELVGRLSRDAIRVNGYGILQKMFEVVDAVADVIIHVPAASVEEAATREDHFFFLYKTLLTFPRFVPTQRQILREKMETIQAQLSSPRPEYVELPPISSFAPS